MQLNKRNHTICFLRHTKSVFPVYLTAEIEMSNIINIKNQKNISYISFMIFVISKVISKYHEANVFYKSIFKHELIKHKNINAKFTIDIKTNNERIVGSAIVPESDTLSLYEIQEIVDSYKNANFETDKRFKGIKTLHKLPLWLGTVLFKWFANSSKQHSKILGSFTVTSLGHRPVNLFLPLSGGTLTFGAGQIKECVTVCDGKLSIKPIMILTMVFDHKILDGALASDILSEIKNNMERFILQ